MNEYTYEVIELTAGSRVIVNIKRVDSEGVVSMIPTDPANSDFAAFLETADGKAYLEAQAE